MREPALKESISASHSREVSAVYCDEEKVVSGSKEQYSWNFSPLPQSDPTLQPQGCSVMVEEVRNKDHYQKKNLFSPGHHPGTRV
jgi:hypothetical protein